MIQANQFKANWWCLFAFILLIFSLPNCLARKIRYNDCGKSDISFVDVTPCEQEPCYFVKGRNFTLSMDGRAKHYSSGVTFEFTIDYLGTPLPLPDLDSNGCNYLNCPIRRNERLQITYPLLARSYFPDTTGKMVWKLLGDDDKIIGCIETKIGIGPK